MNDGPALAELLSRRYEIADSGTAEVFAYDHSTKPPIDGGNDGVPRVVEELLALTDGATLFCSDDPALADVEVPSEFARLYNAEHIASWTNDLREQLRGSVVSSLVGGGLNPAQGHTFGQAIDELWVVGSTVSGDSFVVESHAATTIGIYRHEGLFQALTEPDGVVRCAGLGGLIDWLEAELRRQG